MAAARRDSLLPMAGRRAHLAAALFLLCILPSAVPAQSSSQHHTAVTVMADVRSVQPGSSFMVDITLTMDHGWHTYWKNPGESGLATEIRWTLPPSITAGEVEWPVPEKTVEAGDILTYGYLDEATLLIPMHASRDLANGSTVTLSAEVTWLECAQICVPGKSDVLLRLPVSANPSTPDHESEFRRARARIPSAPPASWTVEGKLAEQAIRIEVTGIGPGWPGKGWDFYPEPLAAATMERPVVTKGENAVSMAIPFKADSSPDSLKVVRGILVVDSAGVPRGYNIQASLGGSSSSSTASGPLDAKVTFQHAPAPQPLLLILGFALLGGLLLNVMPCVLPVLALKIFGLVRLAGNAPGRVRLAGWYFAFGILASFLVLAVLVIVLQTAGQHIGWGFQFQQPLFVVIMSGVVFAFGLSLFGVFELRLPARAVEGVGSALQHAEGKGLSSSFWEGVFATVLATPCTAPFLGAALGFAFAQTAGTILLVFTTIATGMALPYLLLTSRPSWMKYIPKPGEWMVKAKELMGFLLMATLVWLLYILGQQLGVEGIVWTVAFLVTVALACWLIGRFITLESTRGRAAAVWAAAFVIALGGYFWFVAPVLAERAMLSAQASSEVTPGGGISWEPFTRERLAVHLREKRAVFVDFTADWCLTCKVNEKAVLGRQEVIDKFRSSSIVAMRADWTNGNPVITELLEQFGRSGVPLYVVFPADNSANPIILPEVITPSIVTDAIEQATGGKSS